MTEVLAVAPELFPLVKTGGLADVTGALPLALAAHDVRTTTIVPGYPAVLAALRGAKTVLRRDDLFGGPASVMRGTTNGLALLVVDAPHLFDRPGNPYLGPDGLDWPDNALRFGGLSRVAADIAVGAIAGYQPDIVHMHDWQAGLTAAYLHHGTAPRPGLVATVHNLAFPGLFPAHMLGMLGLPAEAYSIDGLEYYGSISFLKGALSLADRITTVSPSYAAEIRTPHGGMGMDGVLRSRGSAVHGILNGIDVTVWDPATDALIAEPFTGPRLQRRAANTQSLRQRFGLADSDALLLGVVSRLTEQKGLDLLLEIIPALVERGVQLALLGSGDRGMEAGFTAAAHAHPGQVGVMIGYDEPVAHLIQAGANALLVPSRFEPCGLTQLCALRYGALPIVARVGGLADTVIDANEAALAAGTGTGFQFHPVTAEALLGVIDRARALWADQTAWRKLQRNAMKAEASWERPARHYADLYRDLIAERAG